MLEDDSNTDAKECAHCHGRGRIAYQYDAETGKFVTDPSGVLMNCRECHGTGKQLTIDWAANFPENAGNDAAAIASPGEHSDRIYKTIEDFEKLPPIPIDDYEEWEEFHRLERRLASQPPRTAEATAATSVVGVERH